MIYRFVLFAAIATAFAASYLLQWQADRWEQPLKSASLQPERMISMASSITETLYALGLGDRVVGVTRYCGYPPEVKDKPKVGGYFDPNYEAMLALKPDMIVLLEEHEQTLPGFRKLKLRTHVVCHKNITGIIDSFRSIGRACGREAEGRQMAQDFEQRLLAIQRKTEGLSRPSVLFAIDRTPSPRYLANVCIAGVDGYFDRMIELAGGKNAYHNGSIRFPIVSIEGIFSMNPDVIIDLTPRVASQGRDSESIAADWDEVGEVEAVKRHRVFVFAEDYACVPGPRFIQGVEDLARALHPEVDWGS
jgi:iron complex transport system substrate-binding protein